MDYELIFWVTAPFVLIATIFLRAWWKERRAERARRWEEEHADDFNKDLWED
jgi:hypothetical protein